MFLSVFSVQQLWPLTILIGIAVIIPILLSFFKIKSVPSLVIEILMGIVLSFIPLTRNLFSTTEGSVTTLSALPEGLYVIGMSILLFMSLDIKMLWIIKLGISLRIRFPKKCWCH